MAIAGVIALAGTLAFAPAARAQGTKAPTGKCTLNVSFGRSVLVKLPSGQGNSFLGGGVVARCPSQSLTLRSDSLESYGDEGRLYFIGHVDYVEPRLSLKSDFLTYFQRDERILAVQNVNARLPTGSTLKGPQAEFFRAVAKIRPQQSATATGRPTVGLVEKDPKGKPQPPVKVTGNTIWMVGDSIVSAQGNVIVVRPELTATGDSLYADAGKGLLRLMRQPRIVGTKGRPFTLIGETIDLLTKNRKLDRVLAKSIADATSEDLDLQSDSIDLRIVDDQLQRAIAWGRSRARARSLSQSIVADSIDVLLPGQRVREMHAVRGAVADALPDSTKFRTTEKDRLTGDTIVAHFDSIPAKDTTHRPRIRQLVAVGHATSLQHLAPKDTSLRLPAINYITGRLITVSFDSAKITSVQVTEKAGGVYAEPDPDPAKATTGGPPASPPATPPGTPASTPSTTPATPARPTLTPRRP